MKKNQIYNAEFALTRAGSAFPDGWQKTGGTIQTKWWREKYDETKFMLVIDNPSLAPAGIGQEFSVHALVGELQRWQIRIVLHSAQPDTQAYLRISFFNPSGYPLAVLNFSTSASPVLTEYSEIVMTPRGAAAAVVEAGLQGIGIIYVSGIYFTRLYPLQKLRLDDKGRVFVNSVGTVQKIVEPVRLQGPVNVEVKADISADIRSLNYKRDSVRVFGSANTPLKTNHLGQAQVEITGNAFTDIKETVTTNDNWALSTPHDVSGKKVYSFAVLNCGSSTIVVRLSISPDGENWLWCGSEALVAAGEVDALSPSLFLRYISLGYRSESSGGNNTLAIWFQAQS